MSIIHVLNLHTDVPFIKILATCYHKR